MDIIEPFLPYIIAGLVSAISSRAVIMSEFKHINQRIEEHRERLMYLEKHATDHSTRITILEVKESNIPFKTTMEH